MRDKLSCDVLAQRGFNPLGIVFPVSAAILERIDEYRCVLGDYSARLLPTIEWEPTTGGNVRVLNDIGDFYRFFDATPHAEFLYACVQRTIEEDLPYETDCLRRYDQFCARIQTIVDMPDRMTDLLFNFLRQNGGTLSKRAREKEFEELTADEVTLIEEHYSEAIDDGDGWIGTVGYQPTERRSVSIRSACRTVASATTRRSWPASAT